MIKINASTRLQAGLCDRLDDNKYYIVYMDGPHNCQSFELYIPKAFSSRAQAEVGLFNLRIKATEDELDLLYECMVESGKTIKKVKN